MHPSLLYEGLSRTSMSNALLTGIIHCTALVHWSSKDGNRDTEMMKLTPHAFSFARHPRCSAIHVAGGGRGVKTHPSQLEEGEYMVVDGVKVRHGTGRHIDGKEIYMGQWENDAMHGEGKLDKRILSAHCELSS